VSTRIRPADRCANCGAALTTIATQRDGDNPYTAPQTVSAAEESIHELLAAGRKIEAIKLYREHTGAGLAEAKAAVEAIQRGEATPSSIEHSAPSGDLERQLEQLLRRQQKIAAIKLYRERTGLGLKEAKDAVEAFAAKHNIPSKSIGCGAAAVLLIAAMATLAGITVTVLL